ncbi:ATP-binding protein [Pedobacter sp. MC2016-14]|uniref:sensor histidine kinase n=1 Tax=Pedobacter sp. MC2016-14 TaxID=2897327 RepID=UPI001E4B11D0|nr:sensor histidine kinase [Pedobacter sp. MC2016-14]MCD0487918.1 ATP-binding protein [Pedobacter sp. MC2016-14]
MIERLKHKFTSGAMSIIQMGEEQIGHPSTAINELVKNAYDADAGKCYVYTQYDRDPNRNFLIVADNGLGMDYKTLFGDWLITSRSSKREEDKEQRKSLIYERLYLGSKGIGRLAAMALGRYLTVITKKANDNEYNWLRIDREIFRVDGLLDDVTFSGGKIDNYSLLFSDEDLLKENPGLSKNGNLINLISGVPFDTFNEGTMIVLQDVDNSIKAIIENEIDAKDLEETSFYKSLVDLITPLKLNEEIQKELVTEGFIKSELKTSNGSGTFDLLYGSNFILDHIKGKVEFLEITPSKIINFYDYRVFGKVSDDCNVTGKYICKRLESDLREENLEISSEYLLSDESQRLRNTLQQQDIPNKYKDSGVGEFYFDIRIYDLDDDSKVNMTKLLKADGRRNAMQVMNKYLGLKVSKNGFGVKPYGEEDQDWLGLGARRVNKHIVSIGPNQILGYAFLYSPENDGLSEKTNREGFFENKAFIVFKKIISGILEEAGQRRAKYRLFHGMGRGRVSNRLERPDSEKFIQYLASRTNDDEILKFSEQFVSETNSALDNMQETLTLSQRLATLGTGLELVYHELSQPLTSLGGSVSSLEKNIKNVADETLRSILENRLENVSLSMYMIEELKDSLKPAIGKSVPRDFKPIDTFKKVLHLFRDKIEKDGIIIHISTALDSYSIKDIEYPFWISFLNILNNAMYWLDFTDKEKIINLQLVDGGAFVLSNTSPKIIEEDLEVIFGYGISGKKLRGATGLGLSFTRSQLLTIGWEIWAENLSFGPAFYIKKIKTT